MNTFYIQSTTRRHRFYTILRALCMIVFAFACVSRGTQLSAQTPANITFQNDRIMLNGQPFNMLGWYDLKYNSYSPYAIYRAYNCSETVQGVLAQMKNAGANTILVTHNFVFDLFNGTAPTPANCTPSYTSYVSVPHAYFDVKKTTTVDSAITLLKRDTYNYKIALNNFLATIRQLYASDLKVIIDVPLTSDIDMRSTNELTTAVKTFLSNDLIMSIDTVTKNYNDIVIGYYNADEPEGKAEVGLGALTPAFLADRYDKIKILQSNKAVIVTQLGDRHDANFYATMPNNRRMFDILMADIHSVYVYEQSQYPAFNMNRTLVMNYQKQAFTKTVGTNTSAGAMAFVPGGYSDISPAGYSYILSAPGTRQSYIGIDSAGSDTLKRLRVPTVDEQMYLCISPVVFAQNSDIRSSTMNGTLFWAYPYANNEVRGRSNSFLSFVRDNGLTNVLTEVESTMRSQISLSYQTTWYGDMQFSIKEDANAYYIFIVNSVFASDAKPIPPLARLFTLDMPPHWAGRQITRLNLTGNTSQSYTTYCLPYSYCVSMYIRETIEPYGTRVYRIPKIGGGVKNPTDEPTLDTPSTINNATSKINGVELSVAPNPAQDILRVSITADKTMTANLVLFDVSGAIVYKSDNLTIPQGTSSHSIAVASLRAGTYTLRCLSASGQTTTSVVIIR